ncbi:hypothetical protein Salat_1706400, partial [Sesamum alatum]
MEAEEREGASSSNVQPGISVSCEKFWTKLWVVSVPPRVRLQVSKFCVEAVPTCRIFNVIDRKLISSVFNVEQISKCPTTYTARVSVHESVWALSNIPWHILSGVDRECIR